MNEIKIYLKPSGSTAELDKDFNLYQGSYHSVQITIYVPTEILYKNAENSFYNLVQTAAIMTTPNGAKVPTKAFNAAFVKTVVRDGVEYAEYTQVMPKEYTLYAGTQTIVCNVANIDNTTPSSPTIISVVTTQRASLVVLESAYLSDNVPLDPSDAEVIEGLINDLQERLNNGTFAARAIYAWNSVYKYGAGELAFYPDRGEYGAFIKSLVADNVNLPYVDGELNSEYWKEIADFNILNELYGLKGDVLEAVEKTAAAAASAKQSANTAADLADAAATSAQTALAAAESVQDTKVKIDGILDGTTPVPKAISDGTGANIAEHFGDIEKLIPSTTTAENQLADKAFVNSSINNMAAFYITSTASGDAFSTRDDLLNATEYYYGGEPRTPTQNDYAIVLADESQPKGADGNYPTTRYTYQGGEWAFQYVVNNTSLTQAQVDAINSGITAQKIASMDAATAAKYTKPSGGIPESDLSANVQGKLNASSSAPQKNLYNLGAYDTFVSNGDGTVTITRKTGYINLNGSEPWETWRTNYGQSAALFITPIPCVISAIGSVGQISAVANGFEVRDENYTWGAQHSKAIAFEAESERTGVNRITVSIIGINSGETAKQYFSETPCYIQYELENPYTETVIENQSIHTLPQDGEVWLRDEWEKGLNLYSGGNITGTPAVHSIGRFPAGTYSISLTADSEIGFFIINSDGSHKDFPDIGSAGQTFTIDKTEELGLWNSSDISNIMLNKGAVVYPDIPYNGAILREKEVGSTISPKLYSHYFSNKGWNFTLISPKSRLLSNQEVMDLLPDNSGSLVAATGIMATGWFQISGESFLIERIYKLNNRLYAFGWRLYSSFAGNAVEITEDLSNPNYQTVIEIK